MLLAFSASAAAAMADHLSAFSGSNELIRERVRLVLLDGEGRRVTTLSNGWFGSGAHHVSWDGRDAGGRAVAPGLYFARLEADRRAAITRKVVVAR